MAKKSRKKVKKSRFNVGDPAILKKTYSYFQVNSIVVIDDPYKRGPKHTIGVHNADGRKGRVPSKYLRRIRK